MSWCFRSFALLRGLTSLLAEQASEEGLLTVSLGRYMKDVRKRSKRGFDAGEREAAGA